MNTPSNFDPNVMHNIETILTTQALDPVFKAQYIDRLRSSRIIDEPLQLQLYDTYMSPADLDAVEKHYQEQHKAARLRDNEHDHYPYCTF